MFWNREHEMGHILQKHHGNIALDIAKQTYYNLYGEYLCSSEIINYMLKNISNYSVVRDEKYFGKPFHPKQLKEIIPEVFGRFASDSDSFCDEFIKLLKDAWKI